MYNGLFFCLLITWQSTDDGNNGGGRAALQREKDIQLNKEGGEEMKGVRGNRRRGRQKVGKVKRRKEKEMNKVRGEWWKIKRLSAQ